jgi:anti-anti-sigma factor
MAKETGKFWPLFACFQGQPGVRERAHLRKGTKVPEELIGRTPRWPSRDEGKLTVWIDQHDDSLDLRVIGDLDRATSRILENSLRSALERRASVIVDLAKVRLMDAAGVRVLLWASENGAHLRVRGGSDVVPRLLELSGARDPLPRAL